MYPSESQAIRVTLPCGPAAPRLAREAVRDVLGGRREDANDATLVVSELVTNAVMHSACRPDETITLDARVIGDRVRIVVHDPGRSAEVPRVRGSAPSAGGGLGLRLVEQLARRWGWDRPDGRLVWAELGV
jgi:anti-sigma regulatory factor (Ser/Thr protein kinase)